MNSNIVNGQKLISYISEASINISYLVKDISAVNDVASLTKIDIGTSALAGLWATTLIYCCVESCDTYITALGNALSYADKAEAVFAM